MYLLVTAAKNSSAKFGWSIIGVGESRSVESSE